MKLLEQFMAGLRTGEPMNFNRLRIMPILVDEDRHLPFVDLDEALQKGFVVITEVSEGGSVPDLAVSNTSTEDVIILDGEELVGAKQNRIVNTTIVVAATTNLTIPVSCVEQHRWRYTSRSFGSSNSMAYSSLRRMKHEHVTRNLRMHTSYDTNQSEIWDAVESKARALTTDSETMSMSDIYEQSVDNTDDALREKVPHLDKQVGFLAFIDRKSVV